MVCHGAGCCRISGQRQPGGFGAEEKEQECEEGEEGELAKPEDFEVFEKEPHSIEESCSSDTQRASRRQETC